MDRCRSGATRRRHDLRVRCRTEAILLRIRQVHLCHPQSLLRYRCCRQRLTWSVGCDIYLIFLHGRYVLLRISMAWLLLLAREQAKQTHLSKWRLSRQRQFVCSCIQVSEAFCSRSGEQRSEHFAPLKSEEEYVRPIKGEVVVVVRIEAQRQGHSSIRWIFFP